MKDNLTTNASNEAEKHAFLVGRLAFVADFGAQNFNF
jgi:hypothetical protein